MSDVEKETYGNGDGLAKTVSRESHMSDQEHIDVFTPQEQKKIIRRIDIRLVTTLGFMYCVRMHASLCNMPPAHTPAGTEWGKAPAAEQRWVPTNL